ncbi:MAG: hypothetical protein ACRDZN_16525, partial [Acidimicrobiales bacterium]
AAFAAGVLAELQGTGLDAAAFFRANDTCGVAGDHGAVTIDGEAKPVWWAFDLWQRMAPTQVAAATSTGLFDALDGVWVVASAGGGRVAVLLASFRAAGSSPPTHALTVDVSGLAAEPVAATVRRVDTSHPAADTAEPLPLEGNTVRLELPTPGVALIELELPAAAG